MHQESMQLQHIKPVFAQLNMKYAVMVLLMLVHGVYVCIIY